MNSYFWDSKANKFGSNRSTMYGHGQFSENLGGSGGNWRNGSGLVSGSLVLDVERDELVKAPVDGKRTALPEEKVTAALRSHSEAERRRRERINAHLDTLRGLVPCTEKMDKVTLLAKVVSQVMQLKKTTSQATEGLLIPMDADEVKVESIQASDGTFSFRASICCEYRPEILSELRQALNTLHLNMVNSEISTLGNRVKYIFVFTSQNDIDRETDETRQLLVDSVRHSLTSILDKVAALAEYLPATTMFPNKRRRTSLFESSSSSS